MDHHYHHQPLAKVRKRHYDPASYYEAVSDDSKTEHHDAAKYLEPSSQFSFEPVHYYDAVNDKVETPTPTAPYVYEDLTQNTQADDVSRTPDEAPGHQYVYDPYRHYQERSHRLQVSQWCHQILDICII